MKTWLISLVAAAFLIVPSITSAQNGPDRIVHQRALINPAPSSPSSLIYTMDFENVPDFSLTFNDWTVNDVDQHDTYGIKGFTFPHQTQPMAFLCFNPAQVTPSMASVPAIQPHSGQRFGACFSSNPPANNDWFISPQIQLDTNGSFTFWVKSYTDLYGMDTLTVAVSTTDNNPASFTTISGAAPLHTTLDWVKKSFSLAAYNNQKVYVAIHCISNDNFLMMIDDLEVKPGANPSLTADFSADKTSVRLGETVNFTDLSTGGPTSWSWKFPGGSPAISSLQNPAGILYSTPGVYPVSLRVSNGSVSDSVTRTGYITVTSYPVSLSLDFESISDFSLTFDPWTVIDVKGGTTYGIQNVIFPHNYDPMAYICFNPAQTTPPLGNMLAHSGLKLGCCFSSIPPQNPNDKWLISPKVSLGLNPQVELWVKAYTNQYLELYNICVSTTDLNPASFVPLTTQPELCPLEWTMKSYSLGAYANRDVYVAIQCVTNDGFIFMVDDISVTSSVGINDANPLDRLTVYPNPAKDHLALNCPQNGALSFEIEMVSILGETIAMWTEIPVSGRILLDIQSVPRGVYLLKVKHGQDEVIRKVSVIN